MPTLTVNDEDLAIMQALLRRSSSQRTEITGSEYWALHRAIESAPRPLKVGDKVRSTSHPLTHYRGVIVDIARDWASIRLPDTDTNGDGSPFWSTTLKNLVRA